MTERTLLLATPSFSPFVGGVERYTWNLARYLQARHPYRVVVATTQSPDEGPGRHEGPDGIPVYRLPVSTVISHTPVGRGWRRGLQKIIQAEGVDLVNGHAPVPLFADAAARACGEEIPFVLTYHTGWMRNGSPFKDTVCALYEQTLLRGTARRAREIICCSGHVESELAQLFAGQTSIVSPGVDLGRFTVSPVPAEPRIMFAATLRNSSAYKGLPDLLEAVTRLAVTVPDVRLEVVGDGSASDSYRRLADRLGIADRVTFTGWLDEVAISRAYRRARVLALPSHYESFGGVLSEAMACGRPVVGTRAGGIPALVAGGESGLLVDPGDIGALTRALKEILTDLPLARRLGEAGRRHVETTLSWERQADATADVFERVLSGRRRPGVLIAAPYYAPKMGGVENYVGYLARATRDDPSLRAAVITTNTEGRRTRVSVEDGLPVIRLGTWVRLSNTPLSPLWPFQVRYWLRRLGTDVVNAHSPVPGLADVAVAMSGTRHSVLTYHSGSMAKGSRLTDPLIGLYERTVLPRVFSRTDTLVAVSPGSLAFGWPGSLRIPPGVDVELFQPGPAAGERPRHVLYLGRMDRSSSWKGVEVLIRAFAEICDVAGARLRLVGEGDAVDDHRELARSLGVADRVDFTGRLDGDPLVAELQRAAVLALPSLTGAESFGTVLVEAMACATPVIASAVGGVPWTIDDGGTGLLVPPGDVAALAAACRLLLTDLDTASRFGAAGRRRVVAEFAWPDLTGRYLSVFRSLPPRASAKLGDGRA